MQRNAWAGRTSVHPISYLHMKLNVTESWRHPQADNRYRRCRPTENVPLKGRYLKALKAWNFQSLFINRRIPPLIFCFIYMNTRGNPCSVIQRILGGVLIVGWRLAQIEFDIWMMIDFLGISLPRRQIGVGMTCLEPWLWSYWVLKLLPSLFPPVLALDVI